MLSEATWKAERDIACGDYDPERPEIWLSCVYAIYEQKTSYLEGAEQLLKDADEDITSEKVCEMTSTWEIPITDEDYRQQEAIREKGVSLREKIYSHTYSPREALDMIADERNLLYKNEMAYEAIEYCILASENHKYFEYFEAEFKNIGHSLGNLFVNLKGQ